VNFISPSELQAFRPAPLRVRSDKDHPQSGLLSRLPAPMAIPGFPERPVGPLPSRVTPDSPREPPSLTTPSPHDVVSAAVALSRALAEASAHCLDAPPGSYSCESTVSARFRFPFCGGSPPHGLSSFGTSLPLPPEGVAAVRPRHVPDL